MKTLRSFIIALLLLLVISGCDKKCPAPLPPEVQYVTIIEDTTYYPTPQEPVYKALGKGHIAEKNNILTILDNTRLMKDYIIDLQSTLQKYHIQTEEFLKETNSTQ